MRYVLIVLALTSSLGGCHVATPIISHVAVFHRLENSPPEVRYSFAKLSDEKTANLEYQTYRENIRRHLATHGFFEVTPEEADVFLVFDYSIDGGKSELGSTTIASVAGIGLGQPTAVTRTVYKRQLVVLIVKPPITDNIKDLNIVYQANVESVGSSPQIAAAMPHMIDALFAEFPGRSGVARTERSYQ